MKIINNRFKIMFLAMLCPIIFKTHAILEELKLLQESAYQLEQFLEKIKDILIIPEEHSPLKIMVSILKSTSLTLFKFCYEHQKMFLGSATLGIGLLTLKRCGLLPLTKKDLQQLNKKSEHHLSFSTNIFKKNTSDYTIKRLNDSALLFKKSEEKIITLNQNLTNVKKQIIKLPNYVQFALLASNESTTIEQDLILKSAQNKYEQIMNQASTSIIKMLNNKDQLCEENFKTVIKLEQIIEEDINSMLKKISQTIESESKDLEELSRSLYTNQENQMQESHTLLVAKYQQTEKTIEFLSDELSELESIINNNSLLKQYKESIEEQEKNLKHSSQELSISKK